MNKCKDFQGNENQKECGYCDRRLDCKKDKESYKKVMRCHDCAEVMECVDTIQILGLDNKTCIIQIFVCWNCKRYRKNMV